MIRETSPVPWRLSHRPRRRLRRTGRRCTPNKSVKDVVVPHLAHSIVGVARHERRTLERHDAQPLRAERLVHRRTLRLVTDVVQRDHLRVNLAGAAHVIGNSVESAHCVPYKPQYAVVPRTTDKIIPRASIGKPVRFPTRESTPHQMGEIPGNCRIPLPSAHMKARFIFRNHTDIASAQPAKKNLSP